MSVLNTPRRITLYWLLLLLPALAVGTGAIVLLQREQERLAERSAHADEARRAAVAGRARLIVENIELLVGDVETGLLDTLAAESGPEIDAFLAQLEKSNPLVRTAFRAATDGRVLRPDARTASEDARGFLRRFNQQFGGRAPWSPPLRVAQTAASEKREQDLSLNEAPARQEISKNVAWAQSARREVQELFKTSQNNIYNGPAQATEGNSRAAVLDAVSSDTSDTAQRRRDESTLAAGATAPANAPAPRSPAAPAAGKAAVASPVIAQAKDFSPERRGWVPTAIDGRLHLFAWVQPAGLAEVRGAELELTALISRLAGALPAELSGGEGYALQDGQARVLHQAGAVPKNGGPMISVPLSAALLPGWQVVAFLAPAYESSAGGPGFFWLSTLLVTIFVAAILVGGALLLWQARRSEEEAAQKTSFVANVSHEFKTPLTTIRLYSELLEQGRVRDGGQANEYLRTIGRETQRLARLVNNALDFSRLEQGRKKYACEEVDLTAEVARLLDTHAPRVGDAGLNLVRELPNAPVRMKTDRDALEQVVINLLDNACKYASEGGEVCVTMAPRNGTSQGAELRVADRGPGVPEEHRERIFEKFHRVDDKLTAEKTGAGLGLSIARQLARGLGGELRYAPREGGGAEFILELP
jgi:two-component system, OmpR family, phosphate regulon sensor histidine kinase PhoR